MAKSKIKESTDKVAPKRAPRSYKAGFFKATAIAVLGFAAAGALGYYSWGVRDERNTKAGKLEICTTELTTTKTASAGFSERAVRCETESKADKEKYTAIDADLKKMTANLSASKEELDGLRKQRAEQEKRLAAFKDLTAKLQSMIDGGKIKVVRRKGRMLVELPAAILFASGSAELSKAGQMAIMEVAIILRQVTDRNFLVAGHTDNLKVRSSQYRDNWELSTARAVTVTEFLVDSGMKPGTLAAAGYGEFDPVGNNKSAAGRQKNRRIEIVLLPNLEEFPSDPIDPVKGPAPDEKADK